MNLRFITVLILIFNSFGFENLDLASKRLSHLGDLFLKQPAQDKVMYGCISKEEVKFLFTVVRN
jgi:hypothetical protein